MSHPSSTHGCLSSAKNLRTFGVNVCQRLAPLFLVLTASLALACDRADPAGRATAEAAQQPRSTLPIRDAQAGSPPTAPDIRFELTEPFTGDGLTIHAHPRVGGYGAFDVVAADMDLDGDMDVFINWHLGGIELCENRGDELVVLNDPANDVSGLTDQPGIPSLFATRGDAVDELAGPLPEGVHVWHENALVWSMCLVPPADGPSVPLTIRCNNDFTKVAGLLDGEAIMADKKGVTLTLQPGAEPRLLTLRNAYPCANLRLSQPKSGDSTWPYHVGRLPTRIDAPRLSLRKPDPHGVAWVQAVGSAEPELVITRGGNRGTLAPPDPPKSNRIFIHQEGALPYKQLPPMRAPRDYARGRAVQWVDVDNDGVNELSVGNKTSANALWAYGAEKATQRDRATELKLGARFGDVFAWLDVDDDGWQDQLLISGSLLRIARNRSGEVFETEGGAKVGLDLGEPFELRTTGFEKTCLSVFDVDADGDLDVWASSLGVDAFHRVFLREGDRFVDATERLGLADVQGTESTVRLDVDNDGFIDVVALGWEPLLLWNRGGEHFDPVPLHHVVPALPAEVERKTLIFAATSADMNQDGRIDLVLVGQPRHVAYNRTKNGNGRLTVHLRQGLDEPIGALVRLHTDDGRALVQRYGSANNSFVSQTLQPLHFGIPRGAEVTKLEVRWPGDTAWTACELPTGESVQLTR